LSEVPRKYDLTGQRFGRLVVTEYAGLTTDKKRAWKCKCDCGTENHVVRASHLKARLQKSCGCTRLDALAKAREVTITHHSSGTRVYKAWLNMKSRCFTPTTPYYKNYGGRGITVCERWMTFENFLEDMGQPPPNTSLERKDNSKNYEPGNCVWESKKCQQNNTRRNHLLTYKGETLTVAQWADRIGLPYGTLVSRINTLCWPVQKALEEPWHKKSSR
jgi:hypothetical protein